MHKRKLHFSGLRAPVLAASPASSTPEQLCGAPPTCETHGGDGRPVYLQVGRRDRESSRGDRPRVRALPRGTVMDDAARLLIVHRTTGVQHPPGPEANPSDSGQVSLFEQPAATPTHTDNRSKRIQNTQFIYHMCHHDDLRLTWLSQQRYTHTHV